MIEVLTLLYIIAIDETIKMLLNRVNGTFIVFSVDRFTDLSAYSSYLFLLMMGLNKCLVPGIGVCCVCIHTHMHAHTGKLYIYRGFCIDDVT